MKNPEKQGSGSGYGGKSCPRRLAAGMQSAAGLLPGPFLRISEPPREPAPASGRWDLLPGGILGLAFYQFCHLPGGYPGDLSSGNGLRNFALGENRRDLVTTDIFPNLAHFWDCFPFSPVSLEKNFGNCKNFVCIWGKMGYNKVYENLEFRSKAEKGNPWQKRAPKANM